MKTLKYLVLLGVLLLLAPAFASCDKDDDEPKKEESNKVDAVVGSYSGSMTATVAAMGNVWENIEMGDNYVFKITKQDNSNDKVRVEIPESSYTPPIPNAKPEIIPALTIDNVEVKRNDDGTYSLDKDEYAVPVDGVQYTVEIYDFDTDDTQIGTQIKGKDIRLVYSVVPGKMPGSITFTFTGKLQ